MSASLLIERRGRVLTLTLNRPEKRNALNVVLCQELVAAIEDAWQDPAIGVILLAGAGKSFCAGMDLDEMLTPTVSSLSGIHEQLFTIGSRSTKPIVAAVHGAALAGGTGLAANAHITIAAIDATFGLTEIRIGLWPFLIFRSVERAVGERRAIELALTGRIFGAAEASRWGLVHETVESEDLLARATAVADGLANSSPEAVRCGLESVIQSRGLGPVEAGAVAQKFREEVFQTEEFAEGIRAFRERRAPRYFGLK